MEEAVDKKPVVDFNHHTKEWVEDPYEMYKRLRANHAVAYSESHGGFWILAQYDDVFRSLKDWQTFSSAHLGRIAIPHTQLGSVSGIPTLN